MQFSAEIIEIERRLAAAKVPLAAILVLADVDRSTWSRWRSNQTSPRLFSWRAVLAAVNDLAPLSAASSPSASDSPSHAAGPSADPIPEISELSAASRGVGDRAVIPAPEGVA